MRLRGHFISWILVCMAFIFLYSGCRKEVDAGPVAPDFSLPDLSGKMNSLKQFRGKIVLLDFWATWCPPCRTAIPELVGIQKEYRDKGIVILGISLDDPNKISNQRLLDFKKQLNINYIILRFKFELIGDYFGNASPAIPTLFVIDRDGIIKDKIVGFKPGAVEKVIEGLL